VNALLWLSCKDGTTPSLHANSSHTRVAALGDTVTMLSNQIWYIFEDKQGNTWFASNGEGVFKHDGRYLVRFTTKDGLSNDTIRQIQEDASGNMYFSTFGGINKYDGNKISTLQPIESNDWKSEPNDLWFYILGRKNEHGPYRYDGKQLYHLTFPRHYLHDEIMKQGINPFFSPYEIYTIYTDKKGAIWFGTSVFGACRYDGKTIKWMYEHDLTISKKTGGTFGIRSIFEDKQGDFWICNTQNRFIFDFEKTEYSDRLVYKKTASIGDTTVFGGDALVYFSHIVQDMKGDIWLTTWDQGVYRYDGVRIERYDVKDGQVPAHLISMYKDRAGGLWLGTLASGVFKYNGKTFERFRP
jgi:ligand-binding sensor domain-containing protein